jgi:N6-L-threonylcarbamoyladenine synthase
VLKKVFTLGIDTSCDDTSVAVLENDEVLASIVSSQIDIHREWGGVVPGLARREHERLIEGCIKLALKRSGLLNMAKINCIAVTYGPGLAPALEVGIRWAQQLAIEHNIPLVAVNHMEGHALSALLKNRNGKSYSGVKKASFPIMALCVSGKHTEIIWIKKLGSYKILGQTLDDAAGEAFDKIGRMLDLGYPAGPVIEKLAEGADPNRFKLPRPMHASPDYNFSFSGLKTSCLYETNKLRDELGKNFAKIIPDYCASAQEAIVDSITNKVSRALAEFHPKTLLIGGGAAANKRLRLKLRRIARQQGVPAYFPPTVFSTDNAAMIALAGYYKFLRKEIYTNPAVLDRKPSITIEQSYGAVR